jgi:imidazolonepropionase-like amidohydrolase
LPASWTSSARLRAAWASAILGSVLAAAPAIGAGDLVIRNARLIDGTGAPPRDGVTITIRDGRIATIGTEPGPDGMPAIDAAGATVLPGLIDTHVHLAAAPGGGFRGDTPATLDALNHQHLRAYLANGVTMVLDPGSPIEPVVAAQRWLAAGNPGPRYLTTGPMLRVPGGYGAAAHGELRSPADVGTMLDRIQAIGGVGVKLNTEHGFAPFGSLPQYPLEIRDAIKDGARRRNLPLYVHAMSEADGAAALDLGAHAIMHAPMGGAWAGQFFGATDVSDAYAERLAASGAYQLSTLSLLDTWPGGYDTARLDEPLVRLTVPAVELATARDPEAVQRFAVTILGAAVPWTFEFTRPWLARQLWSAENLRDGLAYSQRNLGKLHRAGVPIVAATDAPSVWPEAMYHFHGPQTAREVELVAGAGLTPMEAIASATRVPARMLGIDAEIGTVEVGKRADLLVVAGNPLADLRALRAVRWTVRDGVARTPEEWMSAE